MTELCPAQTTAVQFIQRALDRGSFVTLSGKSGLGNTTVLREIQAQTDAEYLNMKDLLDAMQDRHPMALEETIEQIVMHALQKSNIVIFDELNLVTDFVNGRCRLYPRANFI